MLDVQPLLGTSVICIRGRQPALKCRIYMAVVRFFIYFAKTTIRSHFLNNLRNISAEILLLRQHPFFIYLFILDCLPTLSQNFLHLTCLAFAVFIFCIKTLPGKRHLEVLKTVCRNSQLLGYYSLRNLRL